jgi:CheY-like chemotaxis protein
MRNRGKMTGMTSFRILHVDDEPDIRELVEFSLTLDPGFSVRSCTSGAEALAAATSWSPDMILCDVMMPGMDGPATLTRLRALPQTAEIPVVFMTARAQSRELEHFKSLGAIGVIAKPFDAMMLADAVRGQMRSAKVAKLGDGFGNRLRATVVTLSGCRGMLRSGQPLSVTFDELEACAHKLSGAAGIFGYEQISLAAAALEDSAIEHRRGRGPLEAVAVDLDRLIACIERESTYNRCEA